MRMMRRLLLAGLGALGGLLLVTAAVAQVGGKPRVETVVAVSGADETGSKPGDRLTYTITTTNRGDGSARNVQVINAVPPQTVCDPKSASAKGVRPLFSIDGGKSYAPWPIRIRDAKARKEVEVSADRITHVKWVLPKPLPPGKANVVSYQVRVK